MLKWMPLVWANLTRRRLRTALTLVSIFASFMLFGLLESFRHTVISFGDDYSNALVVQSRGARLPYSHVSRLLGMQAIESACGYAVVFVELAAGKRLLVQAVPDRDVFVVHPGISLDPEARERWHRDRLSALIDMQLAAENGWKAGDRVMLPAPKRGVHFQRADGINALEVVIAGVYSASNALAAGRIFVRYDYLRDVVGSDRSGLEYIVARFSPTQDVDAMRARIDAEFQNSEAPVKTYSYRALLRAYNATFRDAARLALVVLGLSFITMLLIAGSVLVQAQRERSREIAVLQALGVSRLRIAGLLWWEVAAMVMPAAFLGLAASRMLMPHLPADVRELASNGLPLHTLGVSVVLVVVLSVAISVVPWRRMWRIPVAASLARE